MVALAPPSKGVSDRSAGPIAKHEAFTVTALQLRLVILGEPLQRTHHFLVGQEPRQPSAALNLINQVNVFVFHRDTVYELRDSSHARLTNVVVSARVPFGATA